MGPGRSITVVIIKQIWSHATTKKFIHNWVAPLAALISIVAVGVCVYLDELAKHAGR